MSHKYEYTKQKDDTFKTYVGMTLTGIRFNGFYDKAEWFAPSDFNGIHKLTWGVFLHFGDKQLYLSWDEDPRVQSHYITAMRTDYDTASPDIQDVSNLLPWSNYMKSKLVDGCLITYPSYGALENDERINLPFGVLLKFSCGPLLICSIFHGYSPYDKGCMPSDEIIVFQDPELIEHFSSKYDSRQI